MKLKRLTSRDFERIAKGTGLRSRTREMAQEVLVNGKSLSEVAALFGMTPQRVTLAVGVIERAYFADPAGGGGWVALDLQLPETIALELDQLAQELKDCGNGAAVEEAASILKTAMAKARRRLMQPGK